MKITFRMLLALSVIAACIPAAVAMGLNCGAEGDWRDINLLPTNGNPDTKIKITLTVDKSSLKPGDVVSITFTADQDCYLTLINQGTSGKITRLWPNEYSTPGNFVRAGEKRMFPASTDNFEFAVAGPDGVERIVAYATTKPDAALTENDFRDMVAGFRQFAGLSADLDSKVRGRVDQFSDKFNWGTAQENLCVGAERPVASSPPPQPSQTQVATEPSPPAPFPQPGISGQPETTAPIRPVVAEATETSTTYLLGIGSPTEGLEYCDADANAFTGLISKKMKVPAANVKMVLGSQSTYDGVVKGMEWLAQKAKPQDNVIVYYSGHGGQVPDQTGDEADGMDEVFILWHTGRLSEQDFRVALKQKKLMVDDDFNKLLKNIPARKKLLVADACHSGTIQKDLLPAGMKKKSVPLFDLTASDKIELALMSPKRGAPEPVRYGTDSEAIMAACLDSQSSYEDTTRKHGLFTYFLLEAVKQGASNLQAAFQNAQNLTVKETRPKGPGAASASQEQRPSLTDPHGFVKLFGFPR